MSSTEEISDTEIVEQRRTEQEKRRRAALEPVEPRAATRPRARFLGDGLDDEQTGDGADDDLGHLFEDLDDIPNVTIPKRLDSTSFNRLAEQSANASKSMANLDDIWDDATAEVVAPVQKKRRVVARMDEARLLGPTGFPKLQESVLKFKVKGRGHERQDLARVMTMYQLWAHQMYPKTNLHDTLQTVEKLCHKRAVQSALKRYRDEAKPSHQQANQNKGQDSLDSPGEVDTDEILAQTTAVKPAKASASQQIDYDHLFDDEDDILAELDKMDTTVSKPLDPESQSATPNLETAAASPQPPSEIAEDADEDEAMLREMYG